jgi:D-hexose-6-phosphate mutarotase
MDDDEFKKIVEINGIKVEVDLRTAKVIDNYRVGDTVKVLAKQYNNYAVEWGVIIAFTEFKNLPTIELLTVNHFGDVKYLSYNAETKDTEIAPANKLEMQFDYAGVVETMSRSISKKEEELRTEKSKLAAFLDVYGKIFAPGSDTKEGN